MKRRIRLSVLLLALAGFGGLWAGISATHANAPRAAQEPRRIDFNRDIRPILSDKCWACHGPDAPNRKIKLRLDSADAARADLGRGRRAIVPGHPAESQLVKRITTKDETLRMPPADSGRTISEREIELLREWIAQGAAWQQHWAFIPPVRAQLPPIKNRDWARNAIDHFVLARLEREGLQPAPEADRQTLIRRLALDLTGLPPTTGEVDDFLNDRSPQAYEKVVDRLLASPRYGERMAFKWLDAARYADTNGYQVDGERSAWRWRDWVIEAFNQNKPYDQFVVEQLAGDLLPQATLEQRIATAFNRHHRLNAEGGIVPEEYRVEYVVDRVETTATVFMGLTMGCARCHNHKYDPLTQREFYQFSAYFNSIDEDGHSFDQGNSPPWMAAPTRAEQARRKQFDAEIVQAEKRYQKLHGQAAAAQRRWEKALTANKQSAAPHWFPDDKLLVHLPLDEGRQPIFNKSDRAHHEQFAKPDPKDTGAPAPTPFAIGFKEGAPRYVPAPTGQGAAFDGQLYFDGGIHADFRYRSTSQDYRERFTIAAWIYPENEQSGSIVTKVSDRPAEIENNVPRAEGYGLYFLNGKLHFNMVFRWGEDTLRAETMEPLPVKQWQHVAVVFDGLQAWERRLRIFVNGQERRLHFNQRNFFLLFGNTRNTLKIGAGGGPQFRFKGALDEVRLYSRALGPDEVAVLACADTLDRIAALPLAQRTGAQALKIDQAYLAQATAIELRQAHEQLRELRTQRQRFVDDLPNLMVMEELPLPRPTFLLKRGAYDAPGEQVQRGTPAVLPAMPAQAPPNRLGLAQWLVSDAHPLTARVAANRFWQMFFGTGLVKSVEDFGAQGEWPSHPELLDWLALAFRDGIADSETRPTDLPQLSSAPPSAIRHPQWNVKRLLKIIVMSATYRQSSKLTPLLQQRDPDNRLLARGPRLRLPVEMIRDQALLAAGLLVEVLGGPSVKPYQPEGLYKDMVFTGQSDYKLARGAGLWRRSLYTFWKRTVLSPTMQIFDASTREACTVRETRTNTPLQSLNLMNDVTYLEAARLLAERMLKEGGAGPDARLSWAFRVLTARLPNEQERRVLLRNLEAQLNYFRHSPEAAARLLALGERRNDAKLEATELAAYAATASLLLNLDEVITKQ